MYFPIELCEQMKGDKKCVWDWSVYTKAEWFLCGVEGHRARKKLQKTLKQGD